MPLDKSQKSDDLARKGPKMRKSGCFFGRKSSQALPATRLADEIPKKVRRPEAALEE
jgi:hypothetical protein